MNAAPRLPAAYHLIELDAVDSTMDEARRLAEKGEAEAPDGTLIWAKEQLNGRGRRGRGWSSPRGNFYASLILRPEVPLADAAQLGFVAGLAVYDTVGTLADPGYECRLKWPNDVLLNNRKVAGILLESKSGQGGQPEYVILGLGVNLLRFPPDTEFPATSFAEEGLAIPDDKFLEAFARTFMDWIGRWVEQGFQPIREQWKWRAKGIGEEIQVRLEHETMAGVFEDLDESGALLLNQDGKRRKVAAGAVFFPEKDE